MNMILLSDVTDSLVIRYMTWEGYYISAYQQDTDI